VLVTEQELDELLNDCPKLYHMAEHGSWPSIKERGLLSTTALLDLYGVSGGERAKIEEERRPVSVILKHETLPLAVIRDQIPMSDDALRKCLLDGLTPRDWYLMLNKRVFFWLSHARLLRLLGARAYRDKRHDILEIDTRCLVRDFRDKITLSPINSGSTIFNPSPRGNQTFARIEDYSYAGRPKGERAVELAVDYGVSNIADYVLRVTEMQGNVEVPSS